MGWLIVFAYRTKRKGRAADCKKVHHLLTQRVCCCLHHKPILANTHWSRKTEIMPSIFDYKDALVFNIRNIESWKTQSFEFCFLSVTLYCRKNTSCIQRTNISWYCSVILFLSWHLPTKMPIDQQLHNTNALPYCDKIRQPVFVWLWSLRLVVPFLRRSRHYQSFLLDRSFRPSCSFLFFTVWCLFRLQMISVVAWNGVVRSSARNTRSIYIV